MSQKQNKKNGSASGAASNGVGARLLPEEIERVRELIAGKHSKSALQLAKDLYKRVATPESEALLTDAYKARIDDLLRLGMAVEAKTLLGIVRERFPLALPRLTELGREISALDGRLEEAVAPLADAGLGAEERDRIETFIRQRIWDLGVLGAVSSLPPEHSLRTAASALAAAFEAVTKGPVEDGVLALPEVSRHSPLAPWKALIRAIACYYRCEDEACGRWLQTIASDSVPARVVPLFAAMLSTKSAVGTDFKASVAGQRLIALAGDHGAALRSALTEMEEALKARKERRILDAARTVMAASDRCGAMTRERLRQHIAVQCAMQGLPPLSVKAAMGGGPRQDAYYFRLLARALEEQHDMDSDAEAVVVWSDFRREAIKEKWFDAGGAEDGILSLHMGELIEKVPAEIIEDMREQMAYLRSPSKRNQGEEDVPSAGALYERACKADPHPEAFQAWLKSARKQEDWRVADDVAEQWRKARATDIQPLLYLMESAEKRNSFKKSLKYLEEAEHLDRLNPEVRRARLRLLLSGALRHLQQRKTHLALGEIEQIEAVPEVKAGEIAALGTVLRWCAGKVDLDQAVQDAQEARLNALMGPVAAHMLMETVAEKAKTYPAAWLKPFDVAKLPADELLAGVASARALGEWVGLNIALPRQWIGPLTASLKKPKCPLDVGQMLVLGEAALDGYSMELGYAVSVAGLSTGGANAEFLFLRARSLSSWDSSRREGCLTASLELARQERNTALVGRILDHLNAKPEAKRRRWRFGAGRGDDPGIASRTVSPKLLGKILEEEQTLKQFPRDYNSKEPKYAEELESSSCDCPGCRARRGEPLEEVEFSDDEDDDDSEDFDDDEGPFDGAPLAGLEQMGKVLGQLLRTVSAPQAQAILKQLKKAEAEGVIPIEAVQRIVDTSSQKPGSQASSQTNKKEKADRLPPPGQSSLF